MGHAQVWRVIYLKHFDSIVRRATREMQVAAVSNFPEAPPLLSLPRYPPPRPAATSAFPAVRGPQGRGPGMIVIPGACRGPCQVAPVESAVMALAGTGSPGRRQGQLAASVFSSDLPFG